MIDRYFCEFFSNFEDFFESNIMFFLIFGVLIQELFYIVYFTIMIGEQHEGIEEGIKLKGNAVSMGICLLDLDNRIKKGELSIKMMIQVMVVGSRAVWILYVI